MLTRDLYTVVNLLVTTTSEKAPLPCVCMRLSVNTKTQKVVDRDIDAI